MFAVGEVYRSHPYQPIVSDPVPWPQDFPALIVRVRDTGHLGRTGTALLVARPAELPAVQTSLTATMFLLVITGVVSDALQ